MLKQENRPGPIGIDGCDMTELPGGLGETLLIDKQQPQLQTGLHIIRLSSKARWRMAFTLLSPKSACNFSIA